jgi:hypothetical protein
VEVDVTTGKKRLIENPDEQDVIESVKALREPPHELTLEQIAAALNETGHKTREGGPWKRQYVHRILRSQK